MDTLRRTVHSLVANEKELARLIELQRMLGYDSDNGLPPKPWTAGWVAHLFLQAVSASATGIVFILLFPIWSACALGCSRATVHLALLMMLAQVYTSYIKDSFLMSRPSGGIEAAAAAAKKRKIDRLLDGVLVRTGGASIHKEYSFPSGHSSGAVALAYINSKFAMLEFGVNPTLCLVLGVSYVLLVGFSRCALGMHWPGDVIAGVAVGLLLVTAHLFLGLGLLIDWVLLMGKENPVVWCAVLLLGYAVLRYHPTPHRDCGCVIDTARFVGAGVGAILGTWLSPASYDGPRPSRAAIMSNPEIVLNFQTAVDPATTWAGVAVRASFAMASMIVAELVVKNVAEAVLSRLIPRSFVPLCDGEDTSTGTPTLKSFWPAAYIWSRYLSHIAFSFTLLYFQPHFAELLPAAPFS